MTEEKDLVVVGGGPAGLTAGIYGKRAELDLVVLDSGVGGGQVANAGLVENYPGFPEGIRGLELAENFKKHAEKTGVAMRVLEPVEKIKKKGKYFVISSSKNDYQSKAAIVATGLVYKKLGVPGEEKFSGKGVSYCATCDGAFFKGKKVAVVGGGTGAAMAALNLADLASEIFLVTKRDSPKVAEKIIETRLKKAKNIKIVPNSSVKEIKGENKVDGLQIEGKGGDKNLDVEGVFVEVGKSPQTHFLESAGVELKNGYVVSNGHQATNIPGLFCAGDAVSGSVKQIGVAVAQGSVAALSAYKYIKDNF
jgi:thioredoxin reductase (NADPH)